MSESTLTSAQAHVGGVEEYYSRLLYDVDKRLAAYAPISGKDRTTTILLSIVRHLPLDGAINIHDDIVQSDTDNHLRALATSLLTSVLTPFQFSGGKTPAPVLSPRSAVEAGVEDLSEVIEPAVREQKQLKEAALQRDGYRCVISKYFDEKHPPLPDNAPATTGPPTALTQACHILPFHLASFSQARGSNSDSAAIIWDGIYRCFPELRSRISFSPDKINDLSNILTLIDVLHAPFGAFWFSFQATQIPDEYHIVRHKVLPSVYDLFLPADGIVQFRRHGSATQPLPSAELLATHHVVAHILNAKGMAEHIEELIQEREMVQCLASDGSTNVESLLFIPV